MTRGCCWPLWRDDERPTHLYCDVEAVAGARSRYCEHHLARSRRQPGEPVHVHDPKRARPGFNAFDVTEAKPPEQPKRINVNRLGSRPCVLWGEVVALSERTGVRSDAALAALLGVGVNSVRRARARAGGVPLMQRASVKCDGEAEVQRAAA
jgi:hypothetical protein